MTWNEKMRFVSMDDLARLHYGRLFWKNPVKRAALIAHWMDDRHPYHERFMSLYRPLVERVLMADHHHDDELDRELETMGYSLRVIVREIPPIFGSFFHW